MGLCCFGTDPPAPAGQRQAQTTYQLPPSAQLNPLLAAPTVTVPQSTSSGETKNLESVALLPKFATEAQQQSNNASNPEPEVATSAVAPPWSSAKATQPVSPTSQSNMPQSAALEPTSLRGNDAVSSRSTGIGNTNLAEVLRLNLGEVKLVLQKLASVNPTPMIALNEAAELLSKHLNVNLCSITGYTEHCTTFVLLASFGTGAAELERTPVMAGNQWSAAQLLSQRSCLQFTAKTADEVASLPTDFQCLYRSGLKSFMSVPIATDHEVLGALTIAKEDSDGFEVDWWEPMLGCLSVGVLFHMRNEQTQHLCQLMRALDSSPDYTNLLHQLLRGAHSLLLKATNIRTGCRLALLGADLSRALVFEPDRKAPTTMDASGRETPQIHVTDIALDNTLLLDAVQKGKARFVSDCASYIQSCMKPATDIFISGQEMVASIVVLPLIYEGVTFGGFYVTLETTSNFQNIKDLLMGLVNSVVLLLSKKLQPQRDQIWESILAKTGGPAAGSEAQEEGGQASAGDSASSCAQNDTSSVSKPTVVKRSCTEAMLKVLQHELRKTHAKNQQHQWIEELSLQEIVGKGGFGVVYKGMWKGSVAAVKVMYARQHERQAMKDALEMAVLTTVSHPNIIQVYNCFTDMVEDAGGSTPVNGSEGRINIRFRVLQPDEDAALATCNILVMEYCDRASLRHAMKKGVFHKRLGNTSVAVDLCGIVQVLIEVAQAIQHLHSLKLIHCDIKPENVLIRSDGTKPIGFVTKLSDFGLAKLLRENYYIVNRSGSGTVTHLAPELFQVGSKLTTAVDTFSFGIMMWELYTGQRAYGGLGRDAIIDRVYKKKARPIFPLGVPQPYASLAKACWDNEPNARPIFVTILQKLSEMLSLFQSASSPPAASSNAAAPHAPAASAHA